MSDGKVLIIRFIAGLIKIMLYSQYIKMSEYFPEPYEPFSGNISAKVDLSNNDTKTDLKKKQELIRLIWHQNQTQPN